MNRYLLATLMAATVLGVVASSFALPSDKALHRRKYSKKMTAKIVSSLARQGEEYRLPRHIIPSAYNIRLLPFIEEGNFTTHGEVQIHANCVEEADNITLNVADIDLDLESITV